MKMTDSGWSSPTVVNKGVSPMFLLTLVLIVLKSMGYIAISWWWVWAPIWIPFVVGISALVIFFLVFVYTHKGK